jgi:hypothetical protein
MLVCDSEKLENTLILEKQKEKQNVIMCEMQLSSYLGEIDSFKYLD